MEHEGRCLKTEKKMKGVASAPEAKAACCCTVGSEDCDTVNTDLLLKELQDISVTPEKKGKCNKVSQRDKDPGKGENMQLKESEATKNQKSRAIKQNLVTRDEWLRLTKNSYSAINPVRTAAVKTCTTLDFTRQASGEKTPVQPAKAEDVQLKQSESPENKKSRAIKQNLVTRDEWLRLTKNSYSAINPVRTAAVKTCTTLDFTRQASGEKTPVQPAKAEDVQLKQSESPENKKSRAIKQNLVTREEWLRLTKNSYSAINSVRTAAMKTCTTLDFTRQASEDEAPVQPAKAEDVQLKQSESPENKNFRAIKQNLVTLEEWLRLTKNSYSAINPVRTAAMKTCTTLDFTRQASEDEAPVQPAKAEDVQLKQSESPENKNFRAIKQNLVTLEEWLRLTKNSYSAINPVRTAAMKTCTTLDFTRQASGEEAPVQPAKAEDVQLKQSESPENKKSRAIKQNLVTREEWLRLTKNSYSAINSVRTAAVKTCTTLDFTRQASGEKTPVQPAKAEDVQLKQSESPENKNFRAIKQNLVTLEEWLRLTKNSYSAINPVRTAAMKTCTTLDFTRQASGEKT
ncbi:uncharacterized protein LOC121298428 [Polyodon spathula]|uniref:uncharacterized protein LOC121298428 n=1 Tax=Polyodon spathula TaxID=7913 RepID=UPI001B7E42E8|nr:uncharacterized protein LOC121298428 [Polyodon spathula]